LLDAIAARPQPTAVFIAADHGENFNLATPHHGYTLDEPVIRIPLLARVPGWAAGRVAQLASSIDLVPTILTLLGSPVPAYLDGIDLGTTLQRPRARVLFSDTWRYDPPAQLVGDYVAAYDGLRKFSVDLQGGGLYFALQNDPNVNVGQLVNSGASDPLSAMVYTYIEESGAMRLLD
jgi:arylsulfatase A-like enzyme